MREPRVRVDVAGKVISRDVGGNTTYTRTVYSRLPDHGVEPRVLLGRRIGPARVRAVSYAAEEGLRFARSTNADLVHFPADTGALVRGKTPVVSTIHGVASLHMEGVRSGRAERLWRARVRRLAALSDAIITVSESSASDVVTLTSVPRDRVVVIPHGVDHVRFNPHADGDASVLAPLSLPKDYVLYLGNLDPRKNVVSLLRAYATPAVQALEVPLVVAGAPAWGFAETMELLGATPNVRYLGRVESEQVAPLLRGARTFVFPSFYEGFGLPVLEAMACGTPVLTTDRGSLPEVTGPDAEILEAPTEEAIVTALLRLVPDDERLADLSRRGIDRAASFTWERSAARHAALFREVAHRR